MKSIILISILLFAGCGSEIKTATVAAGAAAGVVKGVGDYYEQEAENALQRVAIAQQRLDAAATVSEKLAAEAELANAQAEAEKSKVKSDTTKILTSTDWTTTGGATAGAALLSNLLTQLWFKRKKE